MLINFSTICCWYKCKQGFLTYSSKRGFKTFDLTRKQSSWQFFFTILTDSVVWKSILWNLCTYCHMFKIEYSTWSLKKAPVCMVCQRCDWKIRCTYNRVNIFISIVSEFQKTQDARWVNQGKFWSPEMVNLKSVHKSNWLHLFPIFLEKCYTMIYK
jgi:hypothetical protein